MSERIKSLKANIETLNTITEAISKNPYKIYHEFLRIYEYDDEEFDRFIELDGVSFVLSHSENARSITLSYRDIMVFIDLSDAGPITSLSYFKAIEAILKGIFDETKVIKKEIERLEKADIPSLRPFEIELLDGKYKFPHFNFSVYKKDSGLMSDCEKDVMTLNLSCPQRHYISKYVTAEEARSIGQVFLNILIEAREKQQLTIDELNAEIAKITELLKS